MMTESINIYILTGPIKTGKTTSIINWSSAKTNVSGIAQPILGKKRYLLDLASNEKRILEVGLAEKNFVQVGKYRFSKKAFEWAKICLLYSAKRKSDWIIVDEVGKLELENKGLEPVITFLIDDCIINKKYNLLFIVRDSLLRSFINKYNLTELNYKIISGPDEL
ncbi:MAG: hypothetical protein CVV23_07590 [Ignavibacteriae bacterium HGW-Ignavibacteriae-2]|jgi:nucleoside-triphosphatase THEP1|nr:MAG: hypothetical protein CVV23_07590 [Ignavibacteriae bacterium HGW-Ignavibacteriae-2]